MSIVIENLDYIYGEGTPFQKRALKNINLTIERGSFLGLIGHTGSGKSTLIQHINALLKPSAGKITVNGVCITDGKTKLKSIRQKVGLVFQYPEHQLFEETIYKDIAFGPKNLELSESEISDRVFNAMKSVGLDYEKYKDKSPFDLSGGQKRRVAIAGVLAMEPEVLILDEPTAGLDPRGRDEILQQIKELRKFKEDITILLVSHSMEDIADMVDRIILMNEGEIKLDGSPKEVFRNVEEVESYGLAVPQITYFMRALKKKYPDIDEEVYTVEAAKAEILKTLRGEGDD
jgi:energy-coupling factor transport system ATP-binding protein